MQLADVKLDGNTPRSGMFRRALMRAQLALCDRSKYTRGESEALHG